MTGHLDRWIRWTTTGCAGLLALIAGTVSYLQMHLLPVAGSAASLAAEAPGLLCRGWQG